MLVELSVGNFRSFHEPVTLSMQAAKLRANDKRLDRENIFEIDGQHLLRSAAIYGANASGKSNLIRAMQFMRDFVLHSSKESQADEPIDVERFRLSTATLDIPAYFQIVFYLGDRRYRYGFEVDEHHVCSEWLYHARQRETRLYVREGQQFDVSSVFKEGWGLEKRTRENALLLSVVAQFNGELAMALLGWFRTGLRIVSGLSDALYGPLTMERFEADEAFRQRVLAFVREADLSISSIDVERKAYGKDPVSRELHGWMERLPANHYGRMALRETQPTVARVTTRHQVFDRGQNPAGWETFDLIAQESEGTQKIFYLCGPLMETLDQGSVLIIDEMEARLHPFITRAIIQLFHAPQTNPHNAQLIFATHDTSLLGRRCFRRDQIWFTEKDRYGATDLYSLAELQVRNDASFDKDYIAGKYGAVPFVGGLHVLFEGDTDGETAQAERAQAAG